MKSKIKFKTRQIVPPSSNRLFRLAEAAEKSGRRNEAKKLYTEAARFDLNQPEPVHNLGILEWEDGHLEAALDCFRRALDRSPHYELSLTAMARVAMLTGKAEVARQTIEKLRASKDREPKYKLHLGILLCQSREFEEARQVLKEYLTEKPLETEGLNWLGHVCLELGQFTESEDCQRTVMADHPTQSFAVNGMGSICRNLGRIEEAVKYYQIALDHAQTDEVSKLVHSNLLFTSIFKKGATPEELFNAHVGWAHAHAPEVHVAPHTNTPIVNRPLRIGYISSDLSNHPVATFLLPILKSHNTSQFLIHAYSTSTVVDRVTQQIQKHCGIFRSLMGRTDAQAAEIIRNDQLDILIDLSGHTAGNRLSLLALKPAPVQVTYLGYPHSTGISQVDYRITDAEADPEGQERYHSEKLARLPNGFLCYEGPGECNAPSAPPVTTKGYITFGTFNQLTKLNEPLIKCWAKILARVPNSKLFIKARPLTDAGVKKHWTDICEKCGIAANRLELRGWENSSVSHLDWYNQVDIGLDPYPYNGTTTTCEALWMGVPVVTLPGEIHASRVGGSLLTRIGHTEWIAKTENEYVEKAVALASDTAKLTEIRSKLREEIKQSPLHDAKGFTRSFENSLREMWKAWCEKQGEQKPSAQTEAIPTSALEAALEADRFSRLGQRAKAYNLACMGLMQMRNSPAHTPPQDLLVRWHAISLGSVLARMAIQCGAYSGCFDPQNVMALLGEWLRYETNLPEPLLRIALLQSRTALMENRPVPGPTIDALRLVHKVMNDERSAKALEWATTEKFNGDFQVPYDGGMFNVYGSHENITTYILLEQSDWFEDEITLFRSLCKPGTHMLDLGTNVGVYSYSAAQRVGPEGKVLSIEPGDKTFDILQKNTEGFTNWVAEKAAISDHSGWAYLVDTARPELARLGESGTGQKTRLWSVDELIKEKDWKRLDLIKMDVEGHEIATIKGATETLKKFSPTVLYELKDAHRVHVELIDAFASHGYHSYAYNAMANELVRFTDQRDVDPFLLNLVAIKPERLADFEGIVNIRM